MSWLSSIFSSGKKQRQASQDATNQILAQNQQQYDQTRNDYMPFLKAGYLTQDTFLNGLGLNPVSGASTLTSDGARDPLAAFYGSGYGKMFKDPNLMERVNTGMSAKGMGLDGAAIDAAYKSMNNDQYGRFTDFMGALNGQINNGQNATGSVSQAGQNMVNNNSNAISNNANNAISSYQNQSNFFQNLLKSIGQSAGSYMGAR